MSAPKMASEEISPGPERLRKGGGGPITAPVRGLIATLLVAGVSTAIFVGVRNQFDLEDSRFIVALLAFSTVALALSVASSILLRSSIRLSVALGAVAFLLVPVLYVVYLVLFVVSVCIIGGQTCYS
jgi:drug/metabolite transporter (DMT)-like permease